VELARAWHRAIFDGVELPVAYYAGGVRDLDPDEPELVDHEVMWGGRPATAAAEVWNQLHDFERAAAEGIATIDAAIPLGTQPPDAAALDSVLALAGALHNEWVRIHPHVNGNGRTARCWANWLLIRYGLPPVVRLRPRPEGALYARAVALARQRAHGPMQRYFHHLVRTELAGGSS
jgi:fido (protein-threonine AMPylation protein)